MAEQLLTQEDHKAVALDVARGHVRDGMWTVYATIHGPRHPGEFLAKVGARAGRFGPAGITPIETLTFDSEDTALRFCVRENLAVLAAAQPAA